MINHAYLSNMGEIRTITFKLIEAMTREERLKYCSVCKNRQMDINKGIICSLTNSQATFDENCSNYVADEIAVSKAAAKNKELEESKKISGWLSFFLWVGLFGGGVGSLIMAIKSIVEDELGIWFSTIYLSMVICLFVTAMYAIWAFYRKRTNAVSLAKTYIGMVVLDGISTLLLSRLTEDSTMAYSTIRQFLWAAIWFSYLIKSDTVDFIIPKETRTWERFEKIIFSVFVGALVLFLMSIVFIRESNNPQSVFFSKNSYIVQTIEESNKELPMEIDDGHVLQRINIEKDDIVYVFQLTDSFRSEFEDEDLIEFGNIRKYEILASLCDTPEDDEFMNTCLNAGYTIIHKYIDALANDLYEIVINPEEYNNTMMNKSLPCPTEVLSAYIDKYNAMFPVDYLGDCTLEKIYKIDDLTVVYEIILPELSMEDLKTVTPAYLRSYVLENWETLSDAIIRLSVVNRMTVRFQFNTFSGLNYAKIDVTPDMYKPKE